jgi:hypothetical protein
MFDCFMLYSQNSLTQQNYINCAGTYDHPQPGLHLVMFSSALVLLALAASPVVSLVCGRRYSTLLSRQSEDYNFYSLNPGRIKTDLMIGDMDGDGNRKPRQNCIFYVNQKDVDENDPNYAKNRAVQFADLMNAANPGSDYVSPCRI